VRRWRLRFFECPPNRGSCVAAFAQKAPLKQCQQVARLSSATQPLKIHMLGKIKCFASLGSVSKYGTQEIENATCQTHCVCSKQKSCHASPTCVWHGGLPRRPPTLVRQNTEDTTSPLDPLERARKMELLFENLFWCSARVSAAESVR